MKDPNEKRQNASKSNCCNEKNNNDEIIEDVIVGWEEKEENFWFIFCCLDIIAACAVRHFSCCCCRRCCCCWGTRAPAQITVPLLITYVRVTTCNITIMILITECRLFLITNITALSIWTNSMMHWTINGRASCHVNTNCSIYTEECLTWMVWILQLTHVP